MRTLIMALFAVSLLGGGAACAEEIERKVDVDLGEKLVRLALNYTRYKNSDFTQPPDNYSSDETFLIYPILGATEGFLTHLAVNPWTGDVWDMDECQRLSNPALLKAQANIKKQFHGNELKEYEQLHNIKPYRMYDLEPCP